MFLYSESLNTSVYAQGRVARTTINENGLKRAEFARTTLNIHRGYVL